ncbi:MAG: hypothetical protein OXN96_18980 [Bryobacterales bacterium]|nr:hypothetical protein [Bryobacterales bacterium]
MLLLALLDSVIACAWFAIKAVLYLLAFCWLASAAGWLLAAAAGLGAGWGILQALADEPAA